MFQLQFSPAGPQRLKGRLLKLRWRNAAELSAALDAKPDVVLLDNMTPEQIHDSLDIVAAHEHCDVRTEASGMITEDNIRAYAETGVDAISMGALTHSARATDMSLRYRD